MRIPVTPTSSDRPRWLRANLAPVAVAAAGLVVAACGASTNSSGAAPATLSPAGSAGAPAPAASSTAPAAAGSGSAAADCNYISVAQLSSIEGAKYAQPTAFNQICSWIGADGNALSITLTKNANGADWPTVLALIQGDQSSGAPAPIPGLGDRAAGVGLEIAVQHGSTIIDIRNGDSPGFGKWPKSAAIANAIIAGLH